MDDLYSYDVFKEMINEHKVILFMRGSASFPMCGFSADVCFIFKRDDIKFKVVDVLQMPSLYFALMAANKSYILPYLYVNKMFMGGYNEIKSFQSSGYLKEICLCSDYSDDNPVDNLLIDNRRMRKEVPMKFACGKSQIK